ncbi:MAG: hypothetical protein U9R44_02785 [Candidatus Omnitrophota bacterium]|nr:hypothetical protein [Candidatus Omnitrophota bacterium]
MDEKKLFKHCFGCSPDGFPERVVMTPFIPVKRFAKQCDLLGDFKGQLYSGLVALKDGVKFAVVHCGLGNRLLGDAVLLLGGASVRNMLFVGACGGLNDCRIGDLLLCENAFNGEGFSRYHTRPFSIDKVFGAGQLVAADPDYTGCLKRFLTSKLPQRSDLKSGDVFTIGSLVAERQGCLADIAERGYKGIELELSAVFHGAREAGIKAAGIVFVSDLPMERPMWEEFTQEERDSYDNGVRELVRLSVDFVSEPRT